jgi:hypothetical protein
LTYCCVKEYIWKEFAGKHMIQNNCQRYFHIIADIFLLIITSVVATQVGMEWEAWYARSAADDQAKSIAVDNAGNNYVTGSSVNGVYYEDYVTAKYVADGTELWVARFNGPGNNEDIPSAMAVDDSGNVYVTGRSNGGSSNFDYSTIKLVQRYIVPEVSFL